MAHSQSYHNFADFVLLMVCVQDHGSTAAEKHALRYLEIGQGGKSHKFLQYFVGHTARVTTVALNPKNDTLLSAAQVRASCCVCLVLGKGGCWVVLVTLYSWYGLVGRFRGWGAPQG